MSQLSPEEIEGESDGSRPDTWVKFHHSFILDTYSGTVALEICTSRPTPYMLSDDDWDPEEIEEVDQRLGYEVLPGGKLSGAQKGRVIYLLAEGAPYGFLTYHFEDTGLPLVVRGAGALGPNAGYAAVEMLLVALERVAQLLEADPTLIYWDTDSSRFRDVARRHSFEERVNAPNAKAHELERGVNSA